MNDKDVNQTCQTIAPGQKNSEVLNTTEKVEHLREREVSNMPWQALQNYLGHSKISTIAIYCKKPS